MRGRRLPSSIGITVSTNSFSSSSMRLAASGQQHDRQLDGIDHREDEFPGGADLVGDEEAVIEDADHAAGDGEDAQPAHAAHRDRQDHQDVVEVTDRADRIGQLVDEVFALGSPAAQADAPQGGEEEPIGMAAGRRQRIRPHRPRCARAADLPGKRVSNRAAWSTGANAGLRRQECRDLLADFPRRTPSR